MAKIFIGIALVLTLVTAGLAFMAKGNIDRTNQEKKDAITAKNKADGNLQVAKTELKKAQDDVLAAKAAVEEKDREVAAKAAQVETLTKQVADARTAAEEKDALITDLQKKLVTTPPPPDRGPDPALADMQKRAEKAEAEMAEAKQLAETMSRKVKDNEAQLIALQQYKSDRERQLQRPGVYGRVLAVNPGWNFVVLSIGDRQGLMTNSPLLVMRGGEPIAKVRVTSIETSKAIADVIPGSVRAGVTVQPGDNVVYEGSRNQKIHVAEPAEHAAPSGAPAATTPPAPALP